jgi:D-alanyl-D-alanine carboxypeptidase
MIFRRVFLVALGLLAAVPSASAAPATSRPTRPTGHAASSEYKGAIVFDAATGNVLFEDRADIVGPPASMTKLMTFAVLHDKLASGAITLDTPLTVTKADAKVAMMRDSTAVWLKEKEVFTVEELIYAMMIQSANDAAFMLARATAGSPEAFVEQMNVKARELGMTHSTFRTPHGLTTANKPITQGDLTSPRDYALLSRYLVTKTDVLKYTSVKERPFGGTQRTEQVAMRSHNHLLGNFAGLDGLKTGYTASAGFCLAATAQRNGRRVIVVVLGSPSSKTRDLKVAELIERGFDALPATVPTIATTPATNPGESSPSPISAAPLPAKPAATPAPATTDAPPPIKFVVPKKK